MNNKLKVLSIVTFVIFLLLFIFSKTGYVTSSIDQEKVLEQSKSIQTEKTSIKQEISDTQIHSNDKKLETIVNELLKEGTEFHLLTRLDEEVRKKKECDQHYSKISKTFNQMLEKSEYDSLFKIMSGDIQKCLMSGNGAVSMIQRYFHLDVSPEVFEYIFNKYQISKNYLELRSNGLQGSRLLLDLVLKYLKENPNLKRKKLIHFPPLRKFLQIGLFDTFYATEESLSITFKLYKKLIERKILEKSFNEDIISLEIEIEHFRSLNFSRLNSHNFISEMKSLKVLRDDSQRLGLKVYEAIYERNINIEVSPVIDVK